MIGNESKDDEHKPRIPHPGLLFCADEADTVRRPMPKRTPFYDFHIQAGGKLVDFAGWEMPILYRSIVDEHEQTRKSGSIFDVSHMGRLHFTGPDAAKFLNKALTRNVADQKVRQ